ncbi:TOBE domain-containing protein, partial [Rhizobium ruizarguesonis]
GGAVEEVTFGIRPEHLSLAEGAITLSTVNVDLFENLGGATMLYTTTPDNQLLTFALDVQQKVERGANVKASFDDVGAADTATNDRHRPD